MPDEGRCEGLILLESLGRREQEAGHGGDLYDDMKKEGRDYAVERITRMVHCFTRLI